MSRDFIVIALLIAIVLPFWMKVVNLQADIDNAPDAELARHLRRYSSKLTMAIVATMCVAVSRSPIMCPIEREHSPRSQTAS